MSWPMQWSVRMVKGLSNKYCLHFLMAVVMAVSSLTYVDARRSLGQKGLPKKAIGWFFWDRTAPMPTPEASVSTLNRMEKSGKLSTGALHRAYFRMRKACSASTFQ